MSKTLVQLEIALGDWLNLNDISGQDNSDRLPKAIRADIINMAIRELLRKYDTKFGQFSTTFQTVAETLDYDAPDGFIRPHTLWYLDPDGSDEPVLVTFVPKDQFDAGFPIAGLFGYSAPMGAGTFGQSGLADPTFYTYWSGKLELGAVPNRVFTMFLTCYRLLPDLVDDGDTNLVTLDSWEYVLFKGLALSSQFGIEDDRVAGWESRAERLAMDLTVEHYHAHASAKRFSQSTYPG